MVIINKDVEFVVDIYVHADVSVLLSVRLDDSVHLKPAARRKNSTK